MKTILLFGFLLALVIASADRRLSKEENRRLQNYCGKPALPTRTRRSMHTRPASRSEAPWVVRLDYTTNWYPNITMEEREDEPNCSGSLISSRHVITAAHCVKGEFMSSCKRDGRMIWGKFPPSNVNRLTVRFMETMSQDGEKSWNFHDVKVVVSKIFYASSYNGFFCYGRDRNIETAGDVAIFELAEDVPFTYYIHPVCLNDRELVLGEKLIQFGYGSSGIPNKNDTIEMDTLRMMETVVSKCSNSSIPTFDTVCDYHKFKSVCNGDSGSSRIVYDNRGVASVAAVTSAGYPCEWVYEDRMKRPVRKDPTVNINVIPHLHWICAATGICVNKEIEETVDEYGKMGLLGNDTKWFKTILPLEGRNIYVS